MERINILLLEDNPGDVRLVKEMLSESKDMKFEVEDFPLLKPALERLKQKGIDAVLTDLRLPDCQGQDIILRLCEQAPKLAILILTGTYEEEEMAINSLKQGVQDYLRKNEINSQLLCRAIRYAIERKKLDEELKQKLHDSEVFHKAAVERELKMVELKKRIKELEAGLKEKRKDG